MLSFACLCEWHYGMGVSYGMSISHGMDTGKQYQLKEAAGMQSKNLNAKDLIHVGIYTAMYLVVFFAVGMLNAIPFLYPLEYLLSPILTGIPFMLFLTKVEKFGMVSIMESFSPYSGI